MPLPISTPVYTEEASSVLNYLKMIKRDADRAKGLSNQDLLTLHHQLTRAGAKFSALHHAGLTKDVLGPVIGEKLGINWLDYYDEYTQLVEVDIPACIQAIEANQEEILKQSISGDRVAFVGISQATKDLLLPIIEKVANAIEG